MRSNAFVRVALLLALFLCAGLSTAAEPPASETRFLALEARVGQLEAEAAAQRSEIAVLRQAADALSTGRYLLPAAAAPRGGL